MKSIISTLLAEIKPSVHEITTVWDFYNTKNILHKNSNLFGVAKSMFNANPHIHKIYVYVGAKGRSGHSATELLLTDKQSVYAYQFTSIDRIEMR
jgi:hypothetical protein